MPDYIKAPDGAYLFRASEVEIIKDELGRPIVTFRFAGATAVKSVNGKTGNVQISCEDVHALPETTQYVTPESLKILEDTVQALNSEVGDCEKKLDGFNIRVTDVEGAIASKLTLTGGIMLGNIDMNEYALINVQKIHVDGTTPVFIGSVIEKTDKGVRLTSTTEGEAAFVKPNTQNTYVPVFGGAPTNASHLTTKTYVDNEISNMESKMDGLVPSFTADMEGYVLTIKNGVPTWVQPS
jgi:hypothetical protein